MRVQAINVVSRGGAAQNLRGQTLPARDVFVKSVSFGQSVFKNLDENKTGQIVKHIKSGTAPAGTGWTSLTYRLDDYAIKVPFGPDSETLKTVQEYFTLQKINELAPGIAPKPVDLIKDGEKYYMVSEFINGAHPTGGFNEQQLKNLLKNTFLLDTAGITHVDLHCNNIFVSDDDVKFIDFGSCHMLDNDGKYINGELKNIKYFLDGDAQKAVDLPAKNKFLKTFLVDDLIFDVKNTSDNPNLKITSNISNFEFRYMHQQVNLDNSEGVFTNYLKTKSEFYHKNMIEFLTGIQDSQNSDIISKAIEREKVFKEIFANPTDNILKTELAKINLKHAVNSNAPAIDDAFATLSSAVKKFEPAAVTESEKTYFKMMREKLGEYIRLNIVKDNAEKLIDEKNIAAKIFNEAPAVKRFNMWIGLAAAGVTLCGGTLFYFHKRRSSKPDAPATVQTQAYPWHSLKQFF